MLSASVGGKLALRDDRGKQHRLKVHKEVRKPCTFL
jgi:hypothetical protein